MTIVKVPLTGKELTKSQGKRFKYIDRETGRKVTFLKGRPGSQKTMPDYVFRYLGRSPQQHDSNSTPLQFIHVKSGKESKKRGSNYTTPKRRSIQKRKA